MKQRVVISLLIILGFSVFFVSQNVGAQIDDVQERNCRSKYDSIRKTCQETVFTCYDSCDKYDAGYYVCKDSCTAHNRDCIAAANNQYDSCMETANQPSPPENKTPTIIDPSAVEQQSSESPTATEQDTSESENTALLNQFRAALVQLRPTAEDLPDYGKEPGEDQNDFYLIGTPYGPFVADGLKKAGLRVDYGIAFTKLKGGNPEIILPDGTKLDYTYESLANLRQIPLGTKVITPPGVEVKIRFSMSQISESQKNPLFSPNVTPKPIVVHNERKVSIQMGENSEITFDEMYRGFAKIIVNEGNVRFKHRLIPLQAASETGVGCITKGTDYGIAYYPETKQTIVEIYDGAIDVADLNMKKVFTTLSTSYGKQIKSVEVAEDKTNVEKTAIPQSEWPAFVAKQQKIRSGNWLYMLWVGLLGATAYFVYRKKDAILNMIKKQPIQK